MSGGGLPSTRGDSPPASQKVSNISVQLTLLPSGPFCKRFDRCRQRTPTPMNTSPQGGKTHEATAWLPSSAAAARGWSLPCRSLLASARWSSNAAAAALGTELPRCFPQPFGKTLPMHCVFTSIFFLNRKRVKKEVSTAGGQKRKQKNNKMENVAYAIRTDVKNDCSRPKIVAKKCTKIHRMCVPAPSGKMVGQFMGPQQRHKLQVASTGSLTALGSTFHNI